MSKRTIIWASGALVALGLFLVLQRHRRGDADLYGGATFKAKSGDLVQFILGELARYGATVTVTSAVPVMRAEWRYAEDPKGFQILVAQRHRDELVRCLTQSLGEPMRRDQYPHLVYKEDRFGVGIVADLQSDPIHIICLRRGALP